MSTSRYQSFIHALLFASTLQIGSLALANEIFAGKVSEPPRDFSEFKGKNCSIEILQKSDEAIKFIFTIENSAQETIEVTQSADRLLERPIADYSYHTSEPEFLGNANYRSKWHTLNRTPDHLDFKSLKFKYTSLDENKRFGTKVANQLICTATATADGASSAPAPKAD